MKMKISNLIKIGLAILFFLCLLDMPYGFYELVRFLALVGFVALAYEENQNNNSTAVFVYIALALLFQPFFKIALGRELWNVVDVIVAVGLLATLFISPKETTRKY